MHVATADGCMPPSSLSFVDVDFSPFIVISTHNIVYILRTVHVMVKMWGGSQSQSQSQSQPELDRDSFRHDMCFDSRPLCAFTYLAGKKTVLKWLLLI